MIEYIGKGKENAVNRQALVIMCETNDRKLMRDIAKLRLEQHIPILNLQDGSGYFIAETKEEFEHYERQERSRIFNELKTINSMKAWFR